MPRNIVWDSHKNNPSPSKREEKGNKKKKKTLRV